MKILVTGADGFIGSNLVAELKNRGYRDVLGYDLNTAPELLEIYCDEAEFIYHLAGVNRPEDTCQFMEGNYGFTKTLIDCLARKNRGCPIVMSSSIQADLENPYGRSKRAGENILSEFSRETGAKVMIFRLPNVFGKWSRPNYNSVIATFCYNVARGLPIHVEDPATELKLAYIDDVVDGFLNLLNEEGVYTGRFRQISTIYQKNLGEISDLIHSFKRTRENLEIPYLADIFTKKLYSTYLSFLPEGELSYSLEMNVDNRGSFTELFRMDDRGQISINVAKPGITKGDHWHHTKVEKFLVVYGEGVVRLRHLLSDHIVEYYVSGSRFEVVDIPPGYTHQIENMGESDLITVMWANEPFNPKAPDTFGERVK